MLFRSVPYRYDQDPQLGKWVHNQMTAYKRKQMFKTRVSLLDSVGFDWGVSKTDWNDMYLRLIAYESVHGDTNVPQRYEPDPQLGQWVLSQRAAYKQKKMPMGRVSMLNSIGFDWSPPNTDWNEMYQRLVDYKIEYGNTKVPVRYGQDPQLGIWVMTQRRRYKLKKLPRERTDLLNKIG